MKRTNRLTSKNTLKPRSRSLSSSDYQWQRRKLDWFGDKIGIKKQENWYEITIKDAKREGLGSVLHEHNQSLSSTLKYVYPEYSWHPFLFKSVPRRYWSEKQNQREMMDWIAEQLHVQTQEDWYNITGEEAKRLGASGLLENQYKSSLFTALKHIYPEYEWDPSQLAHVPQNYWKDPQNQRNTMDRIAEELNIQTQQDWYRVTSSDAAALGADFLNSYYSGSLFSALKSLYPEYKWNEQLIDVSSNNRVSSLQKQRMEMDRIAEALGIHVQSDWYKVSPNEFKRLGAAAGKILNKHHNNLITALQHIYPEYQWSGRLFHHVIKQRQLRNLARCRKVMDKVAEQLGIERQEDWYHVTVTAARQYGASRILDKYFSNSLYTALETLYHEFEWNPLQYTKNRWSKLYRSKDSRQIMDKIAELCNVEEYKDWYNVMESIGGSPVWIAKNLKKVYPEFSWKTPANPMAPKLLLARTWHEGIDPTGYWMSEKYDGCRALWDGSKFISRLGEVWSAPEWFTSGFPTDLKLDGELWGGRGTFDMVQSLVRRRPAPDESWKRVVFKVFDTPSLNTKTFEERMATLRDALSGGTYAQFIDQEKCNGIEHLKERLKEVEQLGGEGICELSTCLLTTRRSRTLLKVKSFLDAEARIIAYKPKQSNHSGEIGAMICESEAGGTFMITRGFTEELRKSPPPIGSTITYSYVISTSSIPKFPVFKAVRYV